MKRVLAISAHPDDETLGCGGSLLRHSSEGDECHWLIMTRTYEPVWKKPVREQKAQEVEAVAETYQMKSVTWPDLPSLRLDETPQHALIEHIRRTVENVRPDVVYLVNLGDVHTDHAAVHLAAMSVLKPFYMKELGVSRILAYETLSSTEGGVLLGDSGFVPQVYRNITGFLDEKLKVMAMFESETQHDPLPRGPSAITAQARLRGAAIGVEHAEAFMLIRELE